MSGAQISEVVKSTVERYGFPALVALAFMYSLRADVLLPLVEAHRNFLTTIATSQQEIAAAVRDQTKLLYELRPAKE